MVGALAWWAQLRPMVGSSVASKCVLVPTRKCFPAYLPAILVITSLAESLYRNVSVSLRWDSRSVDAIFSRIQLLQKYCFDLRICHVFGAYF
jgi:hypothetical protein